MKNLDVSGMHSAVGTTWGKSAATAMAAIVALLVIYHETIGSMIYIWRRSETFAHCFLIFPISGYLIWRHRAFLTDKIPCVDFRAFFAIIILGFCWFAAYLGDAKVVQQFSLIAMIPALVWAILGWSVVSEIAFPLFFLLFSVPFGEALLPKLMGFTADFTVGMLKMTGIPVYREGMFFSIPTGDWSVVEACSGLRYLIASITLGCLFSYINYQSLFRRVIFISVATIFPVIANGFRAYMIVMIGHLSNMTLAVGVDHLIYGWFFFGLVMALLFWGGAKWSEDERPTVFAGAPAPDLGVLSSRKNNNQVLTWTVSALTLLSVWPLWAAYIDNHITHRVPQINLAEPDPVPPWRKTESMTTWQPHYYGEDARYQWFYTDGRSPVAVYVYYYHAQEQDKELISSHNVLVANNSQGWTNLQEVPSEITLSGSDFDVLQGWLRSPRQDLLTWRWYWISGSYTSSDYMAKLLHAFRKILGQSLGEAVIILAIDPKENMTTARQTLQSFVDVMIPAIEHRLAAPVNNVSR